MTSQDYKGENMIFIVGCPRSGTTWLQELLASYPKAKTGPESYLFSWFIGPQLRAWRKELKREFFVGVGLGGYFKEDEFLRNLKQYMLVLLQPMIGNLQSDEFFVEKTPNHALFIPEIMEMLPDSKIVHILRDARDTVASLLSESKTKYGRSWAPKSAGVAANTWAESVKAVQAAGKEFGNSQLYEVKYENLRASPLQELSKLSEFLSFNWNEQSMIDAINRNDAATVRKAGTATVIPMSGEFQATFGKTALHRRGFVRKAKVGSWKDELSVKEKLDVWRVAHRTMNEVGYPWKFPW